MNEPRERERVKSYSVKINLKLESTNTFSGRNKSFILLGLFKILGIGRK